VDPLGGGYFIESLTSQLEKRIVTLLEKIDQIGGIVKAVESGWIHREISDSAYDYQQAIESEKMPIVGLNCYRAEDEKLPVELFQVPETLRIQEERLDRIKNERNTVEAQRALEDIRRCCDEGGNLMAVIVEAVKTHVTEGEISRAIKSCYGTWNTPLF
jgi:methylmalonyl-CoA mutase N-terminal domain/subunit